MTMKGRNFHWRGSCRGENVYMVMVDEGKDPMSPQDTCNTKSAGTWLASLDFEGKEASERGCETTKLVMTGLPVASQRDIYCTV